MGTYTADPLTKTTTTREHWWTYIGQKKNAPVSIWRGDVWTIHGPLVRSRVQVYVVVGEGSELCALRDYVAWTLSAPKGSTRHSRSQRKLGLTILFFSASRTSISGAPRPLLFDGP